MLSPLPQPAAGLACPVLLLPTAFLHPAVMPSPLREAAQRSATNPPGPRAGRAPGAACPRCARASRHERPSRGAASGRPAASAPPRRARDRDRPPPTLRRPGDGRLVRPASPRRYGGALSRAASAGPSRRFWPLPVAAFGHQRDRQHPPRRPRNFALPAARGTCAAVRFCHVISTAIQPSLPSTTESHRSGSLGSRTRQIVGPAAEDHSFQTASSLVRLAARRRSKSAPA
jgi:hypothetical protein